MNETHGNGPAPEYLQRKKTRVRVFTPSGVIEGDHSHPHGVRLSDSLRNAATGERYLLLTDVTIRALDGQDVPLGAGHAPFILVNTSHSSMLVPIEDEPPAL